MAKIHINIGSNKNRKHNIRLAISELEKHFTDIVVSSIFESPSEGFKGNDFYNLGVNTTTIMTGKEVVTTLRSIETSLGRDRTLPKFSSRIIDLDLVLYDDLVINTLSVPRGSRPRVFLEAQKIKSMLWGQGARWRHQSVSKLNSSGASPVGVVA